MADVRIAMVVDRVHDYQIPLIKGAESVMRQAGGALLVVLSHPLHAHRDTMIRRLVRAGALAGVAVTAMRDVSTFRGRVGDVTAQAKGVPVVTAGVRVGGVPVVLSGNREGIGAAVSHLVEDCGRSRPIMIAGIVDNDDSKERVTAFHEAARDHGLDLPPDPVRHAHFEREHAYRAIRERLGERGLDFDAVVVANDDMALGVLRALADRQVSVPGDVAVVGFDNIGEAQSTSPPLTTIDNKLVDHGVQAAELLLRGSRGERLPAEVRAGTALIVRHSSMSDTLPALSAEVVARLGAVRSGSVSGSGSAARLSPEAVSEVAEAVRAMGDGAEPEFRTALHALVDGWVPAIARAEVDAGLPALVPLLEAAVLERPESLWWASFLDTVEAALRAVRPDGEPDHLLRAGVLQLRLEIERLLTRARQAHDVEALALADTVLEMNRALSRCRSLEDLTAEINIFVPRLNILRCFVVLLDPYVEYKDAVDDEAAQDPGRSPGPMDEDAVRARLVVSYRNGAVDEPEPETYPVDDLLPASHAGELEHGTLVLQPLFSADRWFGLVLHEQSVADRHTGEVLRHDASRVLDTLARAAELIERAAELQSLVALRTEQLEREVHSRRVAQERLHEANDELRKALMMDGLTKLQNRPSFDEHLQQAWYQHVRRKEPLSVLMIDVDHFKLYNDTYGHLGGDTCLRQVAMCLQEALTRKQDIAARYGGEEFAIILPQTDAAGAALVAERVLKKLADQALPHTGSSYGRVSASIGISCTDVEDVTSTLSLLELADQALYTAKRNGRNRAEIGTQLGITSASEGGPAAAG